MSSRNQNIIAAFLVLKKNDQVLLLKRQNTGYEDGKYSVIAGHVEAGESFSQAIIREAKEEAGITISPNDLLQTHVQHRKSDWDGSERVDVYFLVENWQGGVANCEPDKCAGLDWFQVDNLPDTTIKCVKLALEELLAGREYSEIGW